MKSKIHYVCPVSGKRAKVPYLDTEEGVFTEAPEDEAPELPVGWGRVTIDLVAKNPGYEAALEEREEMIQQGLQYVESEALNKDRTEAERVSIRERLANGSARDEIEEKIEEDRPLPDPILWFRLEYPVLSDEALAAVVQALRKAGFEFALPGEEGE